MVNGNKQDFNLYTMDYVQKSKPKCSICGEDAVGVYHNSKDEEIKLCDDCVMEKYKNKEI